MHAFLPWEMSFLKHLLKAKHENELVIGDTRVFGITGQTSQRRGGEGARWVVCGYSQLVF